MTNTIPDIFAIPDIFTILLRLLLATVLGGIIGMERQMKNRPAGLRTHILVTVGSTLIMLISMYAMPSGDPGRIAAQVVTGIGFLGAGTIMHNGANVNGLTTAASIWVSAAIGLALGSGYYAGGLITALIAIITLIVLGKIENRIMATNFVILQVSYENNPQLLEQINQVLLNNGITSKHIEYGDISFSEESGLIETMFNLNIPHHIQTEKIVYQVMKIKGIKRVKIKNDF